MIKQKADALITEYLPKIYGFAVSKSFSYDEAEDLCSDIVNELYRSLLAADKIYNIDGYVWRACVFQIRLVKEKASGNFNRRNGYSVP